MIDLFRYPYFAVDTETTGLHYPRDKAFGVSVATPDGRTFYSDPRHDYSPWLWNHLKDLRDYRGTIIAHNASFDYRMLHMAGITLPLHCMDDTVIRACCLDEHLPSYSLDDLAWRYLKERKDSDIYTELAQIFGGLATRNVQMKNIADAPAHIVCPYAEKDALLALRLWEHQNEMVKRQDRDHPLASSVSDAMAFERDMMPHFIRMEMNGIRVDVERARDAMDDLTTEIALAKAKLLDIIGDDINVNSTPQVRALFNPTKEDSMWEVNGVPLEETKTGGPSLGSNALRAIAATGDDRARLILDIRSMIKTRDTFLGGHVIGHEVNGRVYPTINQSKGEDGGTGTGRLSYQNPAMQQIPSRNKAVAAIVKPVFLPEEGQMWLDVDENSFEVRVFAHLAAKYDANIVEQYQSDPRTDFHQYVADLTGLPRNAKYGGEPNAKQLNLSMIFNAGNGSTAEQMGLPWYWDSFEADNGDVIRYKKAGHEAMDLIGLYHQQLPGVKPLQDRAKSVAMRRGFVHTFTGRRLRFPNGFKAYKASGLLIQATAADINKENVKTISEFFSKNPGMGRLLLNTHDSYSMSIDIDSGQRLWRELKGMLEHKPHVRVPLLLDVSGAGNNWWSALNDEFNFRGDYS